jgi:hypothetical protein
MTTPRDDLAGHQWRCAGCGKQSPDRSRSCDCPTNVVLRGREQAWKVDDEAIAGLSERLRNIDVVCACAKPEDQNSLNFSEGRKLLEEAATQLDALSARVKELETLYAQQNELLGSQAQQITDCRTINDAAFAQVVRAEQERDDAYERAVQAIRGASSLDENGYIVTKDAAIKAIRRLAAGTEKEER